MRKYPYAKIYLALLAAAAICVALIGVGSFVMWCAGAASDFHKITTTKSEPFETDTKGLVEEVNSATEIVRTFLARQEPFNFEKEIAAMHIPISQHASLSPSETTELRKLIERSKDGSDELKTELLRKFEESISQLRDSAQGALDELEAKENSKLKSARAASTTPAVRKVESLAHLFQPDSISDKDEAALTEAATFLKRRIGDYTPSQSASALGNAAAEHLISLMKLLEQEKENYRREMEQWSSIREKQDKSQEMTPSQRMAYLREFITKLNYYERAVKQNIVKGWIIDSQLAATSQQLRNFEADKQERIAGFNASAKMNLYKAAVSLISALTISLLLLIVRDFLATLVDTALNTSSTVEILDKIRNGETGGRS